MVILLKILGIFGLRKIFVSSSSGDPWLAGAGECDQPGDPGQEDPPGGQPLAGCSTGLRLYGIYRENSADILIYCTDLIIDILEFGRHRD